jgi:hypothetical protein
VPAPLPQAMVDTAIVTGPDVINSVIAGRPWLICTSTGITLAFLPVFTTGLAGSVADHVADCLRAGGEAAEAARVRWHARG